MGETISNMEIGRDNVLLSINPKIYPLEAIYSAAYVFLDKAYILLDGDPESEVIVELKPKKSTENSDLESLGREFNNELLSYADYLKRAERTGKIREIIMQRALLTNTEEDEGILKDIDMDDESYLDDPEGIAIPWEEKYGKKNKEKKTNKI